jgi:hypothetical protein
MPLSVDEAEQAFYELTGIMRQLGMSWLLDQVEATVALGKQVLVSESAARKISRTDYRDDLAGSLTVNVARGSATPAEAVRRPPKPNQLTRTVPYTPAERLQLLVQALRTAVVGADALERNIVEFATRNQRGSAPIVFRPDERPDHAPGHEASRERIRSRESHIAQLDSLLTELLDAIDAA